jgi:hypothetical protein
MKADYGIEKVQMQFMDFIISGNIIRNDSNGDPSIPNGKHYFDAYAEDLSVTTLSGIEMTDYLTDEFLTRCEARLLGNEA